VLPPANTVAISLNPVAGDNIVSVAEVQASSITLTGKVSGAFTAGDVVTLSLNGKTATTAVAADGNGTTPVAQVDAPVGGRLTVLLPVPVTLAAQPVLGGRELEDVAGLLVQVLDADSDGNPTTPADWWEDSDVRLHYDTERGPVVAAVITATEADPALLRVRAYLGGTSTLSLPTRTTTLYARLRGVAPTE
jgi:hypothetical protein